MLESQTLKKKMIEEFKLRKSQIRDVGSALNNKSVHNDSNKINSLNRELKNL